MAILSALALWATLSHLALALTPQLAALESRPGGPRGPSNCANAPRSRGCWKGDFDIYTDYEAKIPKGRLREVCRDLSSNGLRDC